jgi:hypothetical protein
MAYSSGGLIQFIDYNNLAWGGNTTGSYSSTIKNVAYVMGVGSGAYGYGQDLSLINTVTSGATVTASQWAGLFYLTNRALGHQGGTQIAAGNLNATSGQTITAFANVSTAATTINTNYASYFAQGSTTPGATYSPNPTAGDNTVYGESTISERTITFDSADAARYFFNAGGQINFVTTSVTNNNGTSRSQAIVDLTDHSYTINNAVYRALSTSYGAVQTYTAAGTYSGDFTKLSTKTNAVNASGNGDYGSVLYFALNLYSAAHGSWNTSLNITYNFRIDIVYPESTYLTASWGTPTVA